MGAAGLKAQLGRPHGDQTPARVLPVASFLPRSFFIEQRISAQVCANQSLGSSLNRFCLRILRLSYWIHDSHKPVGEACSPPGGPWVSFQTAINKAPTSLQEPMLHSHFGPTSPLLLPSPAPLWSPVDCSSLCSPSYRQHAIRGCWGLSLNESSSGQSLASGIQPVISLNKTS